MIKKCACSRKPEVSIVLTRLQSASQKFVARFVLNGPATMSDSTRLQIVGILLLLCGALGIIAVMR